MKLTDKVKIALWLKRYTYDELIVLKQMVDNEYKKRNKNLLTHK